MTDLLFDTPWWLPALIAGAGVVLFVTGNNRLERKVKLAGLAAVALAGVLMAVSYLVDTPVEKAERRSQELVDAFERADWAAMKANLDPAAALTIHGVSLYGDRDTLVAAAEKAHGQHGFKSVDVLSMNAARADTMITVGLVVLSDQDTVGRRINSEWQFDFRQTADGWALVEVRAIKIGNLGGDQMRDQFPRR
jgi:hypothetical protein